MTDQPSDSAPPTTALTPKKRYTAPELQKWGKMSEITQAVGQSGNHDGASKQRNTRTAA